MIRFSASISLISLITLLLGSCAPQTNALPATPTSQPNATLTSAPTQPTLVLEPTATSTVPPTPRPVVTINPLTGLPVEDPSLLNLPSVLVSIAHFPPVARPQAGLSYAATVYEVYITAGGTRFLANFYGAFPQPESFFTGGCEVRAEPFRQNDLLIGNRVWLDANQNQQEDAWERGVAGMCVNLYDTNNNLLQQTTTDSQGYYAFDVPAGQYVVEVVKPQGMEFVQKDAGDESQDSDVDQATGRSDAVDIQSPLLNLDAGLLLTTEPTPIFRLAPPYVGPVRSGRLVYADIANSFPGSCLIFAYASSEVLPELPVCSFVDHILQGGGYMLEIAKMRELAEARRDENTPYLYASNTHAVTVPDGGAQADRLDVVIAYLNQAAFVYDDASQTYWRYVDDGDPASPGVLHPEVDRLNNRQLQFENVIMLSAYTDVISPTNLDIHLEQDWVGDAVLFRDGQMYKLRWSTRQTPEEIASGVRRPLQFYYPDEQTLFPLKPGRTWITIVTPESTLTEKKPGRWSLTFSQPPGAK